METYYACTWISFINLKNDKITKKNFLQVWGKLIAAELLSVVLFFQVKQLTLFSFLWLSQNIKTYPSRNLKFVNGNYIYFS